MGVHSAAPCTFDTDSETEEASSQDTGPSTKADPDLSTRDTSEPHLITLAELNNLVRDLIFPGTLPKWKRGTVKNRVRIGWLTTSGL